MLTTASWPEQKPRQARPLRGRSAHERIPGILRAAMQFPVSAELIVSVSPCQTANMNVSPPVTHVESESTVENRAPESLRAAVANTGSTYALESTQTCFSPLEVTGSSTGAGSVLRGAPDSTAA